MPHLDAAYDLARHLMRNEHDAEDAVQDAFLRALRHFHGFRGGNARAWLLTIVRHTCFTRLRRERGRAGVTAYDDAIHGAADEAQSPESRLASRDAAARVQAALDRLPPKFREVIVLRELEGLTYQEIGHIVRVPAGTVMSRLARARRRMLRALGTEVEHD